MLRQILLISAVTLAAAPAAAANFSSTLATPIDGRIIARDLNWACGASGCTGATDESRPAVLCQALAKQAGKIDSFAVDGRTFTPAELDKCNAAAKATPTKALAAQ